MQGDLTTPKPGRLPIVLSAFFMPGAGQFVQKRWVAGTVYGGLFVVCFAAMLICFVRLMVSYYSLGFDPQSVRDSSNTWALLARILIAFAAGMATYLANLADVYLAYRRACTRWAATRSVWPQ